MLIHNIKEHLVEIKTINNLLRQSINLSAFERRNIQNKNNLKKDNTNRQGNQQHKQCQILRNKNKKDANKIIRIKQKVS